MPDIEWKTGMPNTQGYYDVLIDNEEESVLRFWVCPMKRKGHWMNDKGDYLESFHDIKYTGTARASAW